MTWSRLTGAVLACVLVSSISVSHSLAGEEFDCRDDRGVCPAVVIRGDPPAELAHYGLATFRGYSDPSLRSDPKTGTIWLSYSWVSTLLAPLDSGWAALDLRYFNPRGHANDFVPDSFHFEFITAPEPTAWLPADETRLGGLLTGAAWRPFVDLSRISGSSCPVWTEPSLFEQTGTLYLLAQCKVPAAPRRGFLGLFARSGNGWRWVGELTSASDAVALGGNELTQADIVRGRAGGLELLATPNVVRGNEEHHLGCVVVPILSLDPPVLSRERSGAPLVMTRIMASDSGPDGPGACAYEPGSDTGILIVRRTLSPIKVMVFSIHATGQRP